MKTKIKWVEKMTMLGQTGSGHSIVLDGPENLGGSNLGIRPMEMLLLGLGGCTTIDIISILAKMQQQVLKCEVDIEATRVEKHPKVFDKIHLEFKLSGNNLDEKKVQKAIKLSAEKYCSASIMLGNVATITHNFKIY